MPKNAQTIAQLHSSPHASKYSKFSKPGFNSTGTVNFQMFKLHLEKAEEPEIKLPTSTRSSTKQECSRKSCFIDYAKDFNCVDLNELWKFFKRWEYQTT